MKKNIWIDITNTPQVHFLCAIARDLGKIDYDYVYSARDFSETLSILEKNEIHNYLVFGGYHGRKKISKAFGLIKRFCEIYSSKINFDVSLSCGSDGAIWTSFLKGKKSIAFGDNDLAKQWSYGRFVDYAFFPDAIDEKVLTRQGIKKNKLIQYPGYKEDVYLADYEPDLNFLNKIPFEKYVIVRPENIQANYIKNPQAEIITPKLLKHLNKMAINILYLPRYESDKAFCENLQNVFVPDEPVNGMDAVYYSQGVFTGAGTLAREAACLGVPSFSFFAGNDLLAVDKKLIKEGKMFFSREPDELISNFQKSNRASSDLSRSKLVRNWVIKELIKRLSIL